MLIYVHLLAKIDYLHNYYVVPYKSVVIIPSTVDTPTAGEMYSLNCSVSIINSTDPPTYQWFKGQASDGFQLSNVSQLQFSTLKPSDAGLYTCQVTVRGVIMKGTTTVTVKCRYLLYTLMV